MFKPLVVVSTAFLVVAAGGVAQAAVTFNFAALYSTNVLVSGVYANFDIITEDVDESDALLEGPTFGNLLTSSSYSVDAEIDGDIYASGAASVVNALTFADAANGAFTLSATAELNNFEPGTRSAFSNYFYDFYVFTIDTASRLNLAFSGGGRLTLSNDQTGQIFYGDLGDGQRAFNLTAGTYALTYDNSGVAVASKVGVGSASGDINRTLAFSITDAPVPEPSTWAMMILGFGAAGAMLRRRAPALA